MTRSLISPDTRLRHAGSQRRKRRPRRLRGLAAAVVVTGAVAGGAVATFSALTRKGIESACTVSAGSGATFTLAPVQGQNAAIIAAVAMKLGLPDHAVTVALATALQESRLQDLPYGDRDSVGLFQQRPSQGWGTTAQLLDPVYAATAFYTKLTHVPGWEAMAVTEAAQSVQQSAAPSAYAQWDSEARALAVALTGETAAGFTCRLAGFAGAAPSSSTLETAAANELGSPVVGTTFATKAGWVAAYWLVAHAWQYHVHQVTFAGWVWTPRSGGWSRVSAGPAGQVSFG